MTENLDRSRRYLVPIARLELAGEPDVVHLTVYQWIPKAREWFTGLALCGRSTEGEPLPDGTKVTCAGCLEKKEDYDRYLAPGYRPEDDDPKALRAGAEKAEAALDLVRAEVAMLCECCGYNRERMARIRRALGLDVEGVR